MRSSQTGTAPRTIRLACLLSVFVLVIAAGLATQPTRALAAGHNSGTYSGRSYYCHYGNDNISCQFYDADQQGAYWDGMPNPCYYPNFYNLTFNSFDPPGYADGMGAPVWNDAASLANSVRFPMYIFYNQNYTGNYDYLPAYTYGNSSSYTLNNNASGYIDC
jgi:hypothetical protein